MSDGTHIAWSDATLNIATGCTRISAGCAACYIERTPPFRMAGRRFTGGTGPHGIGATTGILLHPGRVTLPLRWRKPRNIFVNSLADLFHEAVPDELIARLIAVACYTPQHRYQLLTKRPARMAALFTDDGFIDLVTSEILALCCDKDGRPDLAFMDRAVNPNETWPLPNIHAGVSVEDQAAAELRIPKLLATPAPVRWLSCEPLISPVDLRDHLFDECRCLVPGFESAGQHAPDCSSFFPRRAGITWLVLGGESGPGARPMDLAWVRSLIEQCRAAGAAPFVKQLGSVWAKQAGARDPKGGDPAEWPEDLRVREMPRQRGT